MTDFERYKELKAKLDIVYDGIHYNRVCAIMVFNIVNKRINTSSLSFIIKTLARPFFSIDVSSFKLSNGAYILATFGQSERRDHKELYQTVIDKFEDAVSSHFSCEWRRKLSLNIMATISIFKNIFKSLKYSNLSLWDKVVISSYFAYFRNINKELLRLELRDVEKYITLCACTPFEDLITQHMKLRGIKTYTIQEGVYYVHTVDPPVDGVQYENFDSDYLLSWGQFSIEEFARYGIDRSHLLLAGYPKKVDVKSLKKDNKLSKCMVLLARYSYQETNFRLLDILSQYTSQYQFCLKLHPSCDFELFKEYADNHNMEIIPMTQTIDQSLNQELFDFTIAINTTAYYESLMRGIPSLRYTDHSFDLTAGYEKDVFMTTDEFKNALSNLTLLDIESYQTITNDVLEYAIGLNIDNYKSIILKS